MRQRGQSKNVSQICRSVSNKCKNSKYSWKLIKNSIESLDLEILTLSNFKGGFSFVIQQSRNMWSKHIKTTTTK